jgi:sortase A
MRLARVLGVVGRVFITAGVLILLFVVYQLWGTGIREAQSQRQLKDEFAQRVDGGDPGTTTSTTPGATVPPTVAPSVATTAAEGDPVAHIQIPAIGVDKIVVEGVGVPDLKKGPGHYPGSPMPGQKGNAAIAGHRTTYGAWFRRINQLKPGDAITLTMPYGRFTYKVERTRIVPPTAVWVTQRVSYDRLILSACHPLYSAAKRIVVFAKLTQSTPRGVAA